MLATIIRPRFLPDSRVTGKTFFNEPDTFSFGTKAH